MGNPYRCWLCNTALIQGACPNQYCPPVAGVPLDGSAPMAPAEPDVRQLRDAVVDAVLAYGEWVTQYAMLVAGVRGSFTAADLDRAAGMRAERFRAVQTALAELTAVADQATRG